MGFLTRAIKAFSLEDPAQPLLPYSALMESLGIGKSDAGVMVNEKQAMRLTTAFSCLTVISSDLGALPLSVFQTLPDGSIREAVEHRLYSLIHDAPNAKMSSMSFRGAMLCSALGWGNAYALIRRDKANRVVSLDPLPSDRTSPALVKGELIYVTTATKDGMPASIAAEDMLHIMGMSFDGIVGMSPIGTCKNAFGVALAAEKFGAQFFGNGAKASGVFMHPGELDAEAYENLKKSVREMATGDNALRPLVLEEGMTWTQASIAPNDAQFLQTRQFQRSEIAALFRVPLHLLQDLQRATNNNIEHQSLDYIRYCLRPWAVKIEQEINRKLLGGTTYHVSHDFNEFQRGDFASQTAGFQTLRNIGVYSTNDIFKAMHQNPISVEDGGDLRIVPINFMPMPVMAAQKEPLALPAPAETSDTDEGTPITDRARGPILASYRRLFRDAVGRIVNRAKFDEQFAYRAIYPAVASMAEAVLASAGLAPQLSERDQYLVAEYVQVVTRFAAEWKREGTALQSTAQTEGAYAFLRKTLLGEA